MITLTVLEKTCDSIIIIYYRKKLEIFNANR